MSMTREEKRKLLIDLIVEAKKTDPEIGSYTEWLADFLVGYGVSFNPITREQVEKMRGEWTTDGVCSRCGFDAMYYKGVPVQVRTNYCPTCGSPMTDEAVETIMKRMEEMRND